MKVLATFLLGSGLFVGTALGMLALQGRLNYAGTRGLPLVHSLFDPPVPEEDGQEEAEAEGQEEAEEDGAEVDSAEAESGQAHEAVSAPPTEAGMPYNIGRSVNPSAETGGEPLRVGEEPTPEDGGRHRTKEAAAHKTSSEQQDRETPPRRGDRRYRPGKLFEFPTIRAGISVAELNEMLGEAKAARERARAELASLEKRKRDLDAREADIKEREEQILAKIRQIEQMRAKLEEKISEFQRTVTMIRNDEVQAIKSDAETLAAFEPRFASQLIQQWWRSEEGQVRVVKILALMDTEAVHAILQTMDPAQAREILDKRAKVVRPTGGR